MFKLYTIVLVFIFSQIAQSNEPECPAPFDVESITLNPYSSSSLKKKGDGVEFKINDYTSTHRCSPEYLSGSEYSTLRGPNLVLTSYRQELVGCSFHILLGGEGESKAVCKCDISKSFQANCGIKNAIMTNAVNQNYPPTSSGSSASAAH